MNPMNPIRSYLGDMINDFRTTGDWKINATMKLTFTPTKDNDEDQLQHSKSSNEKTWLVFFFPFA